MTSLAWLTTAGPEFRPSASVEVRLSGGTVVVELDTSGTIDVAAERRRLEKDLAAAHKELASTTAKLANEDFLGKAPKTSSTRSGTVNAWPRRKPSGSTRG